MAERWDAAVVGAGPNGLGAALRLAQAGRRVLVLEAASQPGGGLRSMELIEPGFLHDICSTVQSLTPLSPAFAALDLQLDFVTPPAAIAHPLDDGTAVMVYPSIEQTVAGLGLDAAAYRRLIEPLTRRVAPLLAEILAPLNHLPRHPLLLARFGLPALLPATRLAKLAFNGPRAAALFAGAAAHSGLSLQEPLTSAFGLVMLVSAHAAGWPFARGGSASVAAAMVQRLTALGGEVRCGQRVERLPDLPDAGAVLLDLVPQGVLAVAGSQVSARYRSGLRRYRLGPGVFKMDWTLNGPIPWRASECSLAGTVHLGGTLDEIAAAEYAVAHGRNPERPFVLLTQPTLFDPSRAPAGKHIAWAYCHVPNGSTEDRTEAIERQIERFAPGFRDLIRERSAWAPADLELHELNCIGGDVNGGRQDWRQLVTRPALRWNQYTTPDPKLFICSSATPPGGGIHAMCGWNAAGAVLRRVQ